MKILFVIPALSPIYGGTSQAVLDLADAIGRRGNRIDIVSTNAAGSTQLDVPLDQWIEHDYYRVKYFPYASWFDYKFSLPLTLWLLGHVKDYNIVHTNAIFSYPVFPAHLASLLSNIPYVMTPHGMLDPWALKYKAFKKNIYYKLFERPFLNRASAIQMLCNSEMEKAQALKLKAKIAVIPNGIYKADFQVLPGPELFLTKFPHTKGKKLLLFLGRVDPKKGLDLLAEAFGKIYRQFPNTHLIIAGPDNIGFSSKIKTLFMQNNCLDAVTFTGMLRGELKLSALAAATIYVAPSYSEGFSVSVLEGLASKLPCVLTTGCNFPEAASTNSAIVVNTDSESIANALSWCLNNSSEATSMANRAQQFIFKTYTWDRVADKLEQLYKSLLLESASKANEIKTTMRL
jgi:glycosyltransferase involved in cell wall biosynthesis